MKIKKTKIPFLVWVVESLNWTFLVVGLYFMRRQESMNPYIYAQILIFLFVLIENVDLISLILKRNKSPVKRSWMMQGWVYLLVLFLSTTLLVSLISVFSTYSRSLLYQISYSPDQIHWITESVRLFFWLVCFMASAAWMILLYFFSEIILVRICQRQVRRNSFRTALKYSLWMTLFTAVFLIIFLLVLWILLQIHGLISIYWLSSLYIIFTVFVCLLMTVIWIAFSLQLKSSYIFKITKKSRVQSND